MKFLRVFLLGLLLMSSACFSEEIICPYVDEWMILGPFPTSSVKNALRDNPFPDTIRNEGAIQPPTEISKEIHWQECLSSSSDVKLLSLFGKKENCFAYAHAYVNSATDQRVAMYVGSDDGAVVWINGKRVCESPVATRVFKIDEDRSVVNLRKGWNRVLVKIVQLNYDWRFSLRFGTFSADKPLIVRRFKPDSATEVIPIPGHAELSVDFSQKISPARQKGSGILISFSTPNPPDDELLLPIKPRMFRTFAEDRWLFSLYPRMRQTAEHIQVVLYDSYKFEHLRGNPDPVWPGDNGDWSLWEALVENRVKRVLQEGHEVEWDIWNEPDISLFWKRSRNQFFETWRSGVQKIRELDPSATIVGPSISGYSEEYLAEFLDYASKNEVLPDILSWHELTNDGRLIPLHVQRTRDMLEKRGIPIERISINEIISNAKKFDPGVAVSFFANLERSNIESAAKSCWVEAEGINCCSNNSLDGLLTHDTKEPRAIWWAYSAYADLTGTLVKVTPDPVYRFDGVAGYDEERGKILVGNPGLYQESLGCSLNLHGLAFLKTVMDTEELRITARRIPATGRILLPATQPMVEGEFEFNEDLEVITISEMRPGEAVVLEISPTR